MVAFVLWRAAINTPASNDFIKNEIDTEKLALLMVFANPSAKMVFASIF